MKNYKHEKYVNSVINSKLSMFNFDSYTSNRFRFYFPDNYKDYPEITGDDAKDFYVIKSEDLLKSQIFELLDRNKRKGFENFIYFSKTDPDIPQYMGNGIINCSSVITNFINRTGYQNINYKLDKELDLLTNDIADKFIARINSLTSNTNIILGFRFRYLINPEYGVITPELIARIVYAVSCCAGPYMIIFGFMPFTENYCSAVDFIISNACRDEVCESLNINGAHTKLFYKLIENGIVNKINLRIENILDKDKFSKIIY